MRSAISQQAFVVLSSLGYHDYEGIAVLDDEKPRVVRDLGDKTWLMLRNHAFFAMYLFEIACMVQVRAQAGGELVPIPQTVLDRAPAQMAQLTLGSGGVLAWPALLRRLDRKSPGYAT